METLTKNTRASNIRKRFSALPEPIRDWLTSERATLLIIEINKRLNVPEYALSSIPALVTRLVVGDIHPTDIINELSLDIDVSPSAAQTLYHEIEEKILKPIEADLRAVGVDIHLIKLGATIEPKTDVRPLPATIPPPQNQPSFVSQAPAVKPLQPPATPEAGQAAPPSMASEEENEETAAPFILHEEKSGLSPATPRAQPSVSFDILRSPRPAPPPKPITAKIESPFNPPTKEEPRRVVHYSNLRTPLDNSSQ